MKNGFPHIMSFPTFAAYLYPPITIPLSEYLVRVPVTLYAHYRSRLAEAYLNYAEALVECGETTQEVLDYVNKIRVRAGVRPYTFGATDDNNIHVDADQSALRNIIRMERRVELCCEGLRYNDLRRWKEAETVLNGPFYGMNYNGTNASTFYQRTVYQTRVYRKSYYWFPIHQSELDKNENLVQNPYWAE